SSDVCSSDLVSRVFFGGARRNTMKKRKHRRKAWKIVLAVLAVVILFAAIVVFGFRTRSIEVEGNEYYGESSILAWIENDKLSVNTVYLFLKYDFLGDRKHTRLNHSHVSMSYGVF